jgi:hypothetical protein
MADTDPNVTALQKQVAALATQIQALQDTLKSHQHLAQDGSSKTEAKVNLKASTLYLSGGSINSGEFLSAPFTIFDNQNKPTDGPGRRSIAMQMLVAGVKESAGEQDEMVLAVGKASQSSNVFDFAQTNLAEIFILHEPQDLHTPPYSFFGGIRTPYIDKDDTTFPASGLIVGGGTLLTDNTLSLNPGDLVGCRISLYNQSGGLLEGWKVVANTATTISINGAWASASGNYYYEVYAPMFLGLADNPWRRLYLDNEGGMAIRFGQGATSGATVFGLYYDSGVPTMAANPGSLYINTAGGVGTSLYVNEGGGATGWVAYGAPVPSSTVTVAPVSGSFNVLYTNTSGHAQLHLVSVYFQVPNTGSSAVATFKVAGSGVAEISLQNPVSSNFITSELMLVALVPAGSTYEIVTTLTGTGYAQLIFWNAVNF